MSNVNTGELLDFQDYSPDPNERHARIDVEAVHTNQYNNTMSNPNYTYEEPKPIDEPEVLPQCKSRFWCFLAITKVKQCLSPSFLKLVAVMLLLNEP